MPPELDREFWERYIETKRKALGYPEFDPKIESFPEYIERYFKEVEAPLPEEKRSIIEMFGLSLFRKISGFFMMMWENVFTAFRRALGGIVSDVFKLFFKEMVTVATPGIKEKLIEYGKMADIPEVMAEPLYKQLEKGTPLDYFQLFFLWLFMNAFKVLNVLVVSQEMAKQDLLRDISPTIPDLPSLLRARIMSPETETVVDEFLQRMGLNEVARGLMKLTSHTLLNPDQIKQLYLRGEVTKAEKDIMLKQIGTRPEDVDKLEKLYYFIPSPTDLVSMAVREAFYPEYIREFNLLAEYPPEFEAWAKKQGMSPDWAKKFWVAHWVLPSVRQGYEMLHRGVISKTELDALFKAVDIAPFWRDKLLKISYSPYTRIDIRRMYRTGVVDRKVVKETYLALGYDDEHAENLTEFTVRDAIGTEKDLSKADILAVYQRKIIPRREAKELIESLQYSPEEAEMYLQRADFDSFAKDKTKKVSWVRKNYLAGLITDGEARSRLAKLNLRGAEVTELFRDWDVEKEGKMTELTFKQLQVLFIQKIIDEKVFKAELKNKGYSDTYIGWLLKLTEQKVVEGD